MPNQKKGTPKSSESAQKKGKGSGGRSKNEPKPSPQSSESAQKKGKGSGGRSKNVPKPSPPKAVAGEASRNVEVKRGDGMIWLSGDHYFAINENGYCLAPVFEGALGIVIQITHVTRGNKYALKIPRLFADTSRENAYIKDILVTEKSQAAAVRQAENIVRCVEMDLISRPVSGNHRQDLVSWINNSLIGIQFKKGTKPRFLQLSQEISCPIGLNGDRSKGEYYEDILAKMHQGHWLDTLEFSIPSNGQANAQGKDAYRISPLRTDHDAQNFENSWYFGVPSILYEWGEMTLQYLVSDARANFADWKYGNYFTLLQTICRGANGLHKRGFIHADIRPANIMTNAINTPEAYKLIDYAGFGMGGVVDPRESGGNTVTGPAINGERISPFYAPERRYAIEKEDADIAIVLETTRLNHNKENEKEEVIVNEKEEVIVVYLGWRQKLINREEECIMSNVEKALKGLDGFTPSTNVELLKGDRLLARDFLFEILEVGKLSESTGLDKLVYICSRNVSQLFHGKIVVKHPNATPNQWFSIPRATEIKQWSVASDVYSIGGLALYLLLFDDALLVRKSDAKPINEDNISNRVKTRTAGFL